MRKFSEVYGLIFVCLLVINLPSASSPSWEGFKCIAQIGFAFYILIAAFYFLILNNKDYESKN